MSGRDKPECQRLVKWTAQRLKNEGRPIASFAAFTGQDMAAFKVFVHAVDLYGRGDGDGRRGALLAMRGALLGMQRACWPVARASIPGVLDWRDEADIWGALDAIGLE